jgi:hypothetical protein
MKNSKLRIALSVVSFLGASLFGGSCLVGCSPGHFAVKKVRATDTKIEGVPFRPPMVYLMVTDIAFVDTAPITGAVSASPSPTAGSPAARQGSAAAVLGTIAPSPDQITVRVICLPGPDTYVIQQKGGRFGSSAGNFQLANGWMLTGMNVSTQQSTIADAVNAATGVIPALVAAATAAVGTPASATVAAPRKNAEAEAPGAAQPTPKPFLYLFTIEGNKLTRIDTSALSDALSNLLNPDPAK